MVTCQGRIADGGRRGAEQAFFSTCGSSLSVKASMLAMAGGRETC